MNSIFNYANDNSLLYGAHYIILASDVVTYENPVGKFLIPYATPNLDAELYDKEEPKQNSSNIMNINDKFDINTVTKSNYIELRIPKNLFYIENSYIVTNKTPCVCSMANGAGSASLSAVKESGEKIINDANNGAIEGAGLRKYSSTNITPTINDTATSTINETSTQAKSISQDTGHAGAQIADGITSNNSQAPEMYTAGSKAVANAAKTAIEAASKLPQKRAARYTYGTPFSLRDKVKSQQKPRAARYEYGTQFSLYDKVKDKQIIQEQELNPIRTGLMVSSDVAQAASIIQSISSSKILNNVTQDIANKAQELVQSCVDIAQEVAMDILQKTAGAFVETLFKVGPASAITAALAALDAAIENSLKSAGEKAESKALDTLHSLPLYAIATETDKAIRAKKSIKEIASIVLDGLSKISNGSSNSISPKFKTMADAIQTIVLTGESLAAKSMTEGLKISDIIAAAGGTASEIAKASSHTTNSSMLLSMATTATEVAKLYDTISSNSKEAEISGSTKTTISQVASVISSSMTILTGKNVSNSVLELGLQAITIAVNAGSTQDFMNQLSETRLFKAKKEQLAYEIGKKVASGFKDDGWKRMAEEAAISAFNSLTDLSVEDKSEISSLVGADVALDNGASDKEAIEFADEISSKQLTDSGMSGTDVKTQVMYNRARVAGYGVRKMFEKGLIQKDQLIPNTNQMVTYQLGPILSINGQKPTYVPSANTEKYTKEIKKCASVLGDETAESSQAAGNDIQTALTQAGEAGQKFAEEYSQPISPLAPGNFSKEDFILEAKQSAIETPASNINASAKNAAEMAEKTGNEEAPKAEELAKEKMKQNSSSKGFIGIGTCSPVVIHKRKEYTKGQKFIAVGAGGNTENIKIIGVVEDE